MKVLDAKGQRLEVGSPVERCFSNGNRGGMIGRIAAIESGGLVWVEWNRRIQLRTSFAGLRRFTPRPSYRVPDLELVTDREDVGDE